MLQKHRFFSTAGLALSLAMVSDFLGLKSAQVGAIHRLGQLGPALRFWVGSFVDTWSLGDQAALLTRVRLAGPLETSQKIAEVLLHANFSSRLNISELPLLVPFSAGPEPSRVFWE